MSTQNNTLARLRVQTDRARLTANHLLTAVQAKSATAARAATVAGAILVTRTSTAFAQGGGGGGATLSGQVTTALTDRLPTAAAGQAANMTTITQFFIWVLGAVLMALVGFGIVEGINGRGWGKAFASVIGSVAIAILIAVVLQATA